MFLALFVTAFVSATLWPLASEAVFLGLLQQHPEAVLALILVATLGNGLGAILMFEVSYRIEGWAERKFSTKLDVLSRWQSRLNRWGTPALSLAWLPLVGDFLPIVGGLLKMHRGYAYFWLFFGKGCRYIVLTGVGWNLVLG